MDFKQADFFEQACTAVVLSSLRIFDKVETFGKRFYIDPENRTRVSPEFFIRFTDGSTVMRGSSLTLKIEHRYHLSSLFVLLMVTQLCSRGMKQVMNFMCMSHLTVVLKQTQHLTCRMKTL